MAMLLVVGSSARAAPFNISSHMTPVLQWGPNYGYCGEASLIAAGKSFGQYTSQWTARRLASSGASQTRESSQLLLGTALPAGNAQTAAGAMRLDLATYDSDHHATTSGYLAWIKQHVVRGDAVIMGVLNNVNLLGKRPPGDFEYDHIVPVMGIGSHRPLEGDAASTYFPTDTLTISDNGLADSRSTFFTYRFGAIQKTREQANRGRGSTSLYSVLRSTGGGTADYAVAVTGVSDDSPGGPYVVPVSLVTSRNNEGFPTGNTMRHPPDAKTMTITATVTITDTARAYRLYEYTSFSAVPRGRFNSAAAANPASVARTWHIPAASGGRFTVTLPRVSTRGTYVFRAVPVGAP